MSVKQNSEADKTIEINKMLTELNRFIEELERQVRSNTYPIKQAIAPAGKD